MIDATVSPAVHPPGRPPATSAWSSRTLLAIGAALIVLAAYRWSVGLAVWLAPVPFLLVLRRGARWRDRLVVLGVIAVATIAQVGKIITDPIPWVLVVPFALPSALSAWLVLIAADVVRRRRGELAGVLGFVALTGLGEWLTFAHSPLGLWGTAASAQTTNLPLLQLASLVGPAGIGMVVAAVPAALASLLAEPLARDRRRTALAVAAVVGAVHAWGAIRLFAPLPGPTVRVAAIVTDVGPGADGLPDAAALAANTDTLFARTAVAASRGAQVVVWNEAATVVEPAEEPALIARGRAAAVAHQVDLVMAYAVVIERAPIRYDNKYVWVGPDGAVIETYRKHHPVPGEPSLRGTAPLVAHTRPWGRGAGAICYDYDFPAVARAHGRLGAGLVVVPSSDWRGIDPYHTELARVGAISGGFAVVRPVRWATSAAFDAYGRTRATMASREDNDRIMIATVPVTPVPTLYARLGDTPLVVINLMVLVALALIGRRRGARA